MFFGKRGTMSLSGGVIQVGSRGIAIDKASGAGRWEEETVMVV